MSLILQLFQKRAAMIRALMSTHSIKIRNYIPIHRILKTSNESGGLTQLIHKTITFETLEKLSNNKKHIENLFKEIIQKIIILRCIYRPPRGNQNIFTCKAKDLIERYKQNQKSLVFVSI